MINELNISIFNYIYSKDIEMEKGIKNYNDEITYKLNCLIKEGHELVDFWNNNLDMVDNNCIDKINDTIGSDITYNHFPMLTKSAKAKFLEFKCQQIQDIIDSKGCIKLEDCNNIFVNMINLAIKNVLKYCKDSDIIYYEDNKTIITGGRTGVVSINYENIEPVIYKKNNNFLGQPVIQTQNNLINYGNNYGTLNQLNNFQNNDEKLFEIILEKLDAMKLESNISVEKIEEIKKYCNKKEKTNVTEILKEIAMGTGTNLIASGILGMFGLM